ncbi:E3 ubiquitin-protein ligase mib1-like [Lolium rigidum]|uniref:E3 ubiquitin-protein ligase mib1-like n=1 Tax=Lolium rigidum TaxID=89674 RepID=UPI001F5D721B|nr:E3 ubiquitin-protein ligase mib1-like [Lolium rigidum]
MDAKLMVATYSGDVDKLKELLKKEDATAMVVVTAATSKKPSKDEQSRSGDIDPLLLESACGGSWQDLEELLKKPHIPEYQESFGDAEEGVDRQPAAGAFLKGVTPDGDTALHVVSSNGDSQDFLNYAGIIHDGDRDLLFTKNHKGDTPLHCACRAGNYEMVSRLIELAADRKFELLREVNHRQETALHEAVRLEDGKALGHKERGLLDARTIKGKQEMVKLLMDADTQLANFPAGGISPMYLAILLGKDTIAIILYVKSCGNLSYSGPDGQNALHVAVLRATNTGTPKCSYLFW